MKRNRILLLIVSVLVSGYVGTYVGLRMSGVVVHFSPQEYDDPSGQINGHIVRLQSPTTRAVLLAMFTPAIRMEKLIRDFVD